MNINDPSVNPSIWEAVRIEGEPLSQHMNTEVCIVGAGIAGMTTAYLLARAGQGVVVLDDGPIGFGETKHTTAHLSNEIDDRYTEMERIHGEEALPLIAGSHTSAIQLIEQIVSTEGIDCDFRRLPGYLFLAPNAETSTLDEEQTAAQKAGLTGVEKVSGARGAQIGVALRFPNQGQFHPLKYLDGLRRCIVRDGGRIFSNTHVLSVEGGEQAVVETREGFHVTARHVVVATNTPINDVVAIHTKQAPYRTFVIGVVIPKDSIEPALYWDTQDPYHYVRIQPGDDHDVLIIGGEDHKTGQADNADERFAQLEYWALAHFPKMGEVEYRWSGQVMETVDGLGFIGRNPADADNVYVATGDSGMGMTHGTIAGMIISDLILGRENPWAELYDPSRKRAGTLGEFAKENLNVAAQYRDWLTPGEVPKEEDIPAGEGCIMREGMTKLAVHRDADGMLHRLSAVCPHMKCIVRWNSLEKTWDCPCHGSRFTATGDVLNGPAATALTLHE